MDTYNIIMASVLTSLFILLALRIRNNKKA
jgi:hypothetical protein